jgi:hypothetical protein
VNLQLLPNPGYKENGATSARFQLLERTAGIVPLLVFLAVYVPAAGHGFLSDDFRWILNSHIGAPSDVWRLLRITDGFYRPLVSLTFGLNQLLFGIDPRPYGWTNVALTLLTALLIRQLTISLGLARGAATLAASLWLLNFHGINLSILWVSGRTALLVGCAAAACAILVVKRRWGWALLFLALALLSKEEAITLPFVLASWMYLLGSGTTMARFRAAATWLLASGVVLAGYLALRSSTGAMTPATAPNYYRFTFDPATLAQNALQYADRGATVSAIAVVLGTLLLWPGKFQLPSAHRRIAECGLIWLVGGFSITLFLPVRSSLYSVVPSIGACIAAAAVVSAFWQTADPSQRRRALLAGIVLPVLLLPVYRARTATVPLADFSTQALDDIREATRSIPAGATVVILDDRTTRINLASAFGTLINDAVQVSTGRRLNMVLEPPPPGTAVVSPCASCTALRLRLANGRVIAAS